MRNARQPERSCLQWPIGAQVLERLLRTLRRGNQSVALPVLQGLGKISAFPRAFLVVSRYLHTVPRA
jgi:hypothetical protein